jgi:hypothetical protein
MKVRYNQHGTNFIDAKFGTSESAASSVMLEQLGVTGSYVTVLDSVIDKIGGSSAQMAIACAAVGMPNICLVTGAYDPRVSEAADTVIFQPVGGLTFKQSARVDFGANLGLDNFTPPFLVGGGRHSDIGYTGLIVDSTTALWSGPSTAQNTVTTVPTVADLAVQTRFMMTAVMKTPKAPMAPVEPATVTQLKAAVETAAIPPEMKQAFMTSIVKHEETGRKLVPENITRAIEQYEKSQREQKETGVAKKKKKKAKSVEINMTAPHAWNDGLDRLSVSQMINSLNVPLVSSVNPDLGRKVRATIDDFRGKDTIPSRRANIIRQAFNATKKRKRVQVAREVPVGGGGTRTTERARPYLTETVAGEEEEEYEI